MPMNLVVVPLEGVSQTIFWQYRNVMPALWRLSENAIMFRRFYSNSTSAFQSFCDFAYGNSSQLDHNLAFPREKGCLLGRTRNFFDVLRGHGYSVLGVQHGEAKPGYLKDNMLGAWPDSCGEFRWHGEYDAFFAESSAFLEKAKASGTPFAMYYADRASTVADNCAEKRDARLFHERFDRGYGLLDASVRRLLAKLEELSLLDSTVIVAFGPYGMDPWKHGVHGGRTRAVPAYADACWTPMFIYNNNRDAKIVDPLSCVIDLKATLLGLLLPDLGVEAERDAFSGVNLLAGMRDVVFTQNLFALERENEGAARGLAKCYAATDGDQRLIVHSDGGIPGEGGMELFYDPRDSTNSRNLLDFFTLGDDGVMMTFGNNNANHPHFLLAFRPDRPDWLIRSVVDSYNAMREILRRLVKAKEKEALGRCAAADQAVLFDESMYNKKLKTR